MGILDEKSYRIPAQIEEEVVRLIIGDGFGLYESYANDIPVSIKQKCDFEMKTQGAVRVAYGKEYLSANQQVGQDVARSFGGIMHYHQSSVSGVTHWTPNVYARADHHSHVSTDNLRRVQTICFDIDQKMSVQQILFAFDYMGLDFHPFLILSTPKGVQFFVRFDEAWYGEKGVNYVKDIANRLKKEMILPIDTGKDVFGWARFPRKESILYFEPTNVWPCENAKEWYGEQKSDRFRSGKSMYTQQKWYAELKKCAEVGRRNDVTLELAIANYRDNVGLEEALEEILVWNSSLDVPETQNRVIQTVKTVYKKGYWFNTKLIKDYTGLSVQTRGWHKHKKSREQRKYDHKDELMSDLLLHLDMQLTGQHMETSSRKLAEDLFGEVKKHKSITRVLGDLNKSNSGFVVRKKKDSNGNVLKGRNAGYLVYRTQDLINIIKTAKQEKSSLMLSLVYRASTYAEKHHETFVSKAKHTVDLMCQLPIKVSTRHMYGELYSSVDRLLFKI